MRGITIETKPSLTHFEGRNEVSYWNEKSESAIMAASAVSIQDLLKALVKEIRDQGLTPDWDSLRIHYEYDEMYLRDTFKVHLTAGREEN